MGKKILFINLKWVTTLDTAAAKVALINTKVEQIGADVEQKPHYEMIESATNTTIKFCISFSDEGEPITLDESIVKLTAFAEKFGDVEGLSFGYEFN